MSAGMGVLTILMTLVGWSSIPLFLRYYSEHIDPWTSNGWRYGASALFWAPVLIVTAVRGRWPAGLWRAALIPGSINVCGQICFVWAHYQIEPGLLTFGLRSQILFAAVGAYLLFPPERAVIRTPSYLWGALLVLTGTSGSILLSPHSIDWSRLSGFGLAVASGGLFACYALSVRKYLPGVSSVMAFAAISQLTAIVMVALMFVLGQRYGADVWNLSREQIVWLLMSALIGIALGHVFYYMSIARLGVAVSAGVLQLQPFLVAVASYLLFGEVLQVGQWLAGGVAIGGAMLMLAIQLRVSQQRNSG
ncbi:MAG: DMT family transporter [Planctomycetaceae bacterium]|nr:DMT family transporter [Planctomycetaceae bacterium]